MKKNIMLAFLLIGVILLAGCGQKQISQTQTKTNSTSKTQQSEQSISNNQSSVIQVGNIEIIQSKKFENWEKYNDSKYAFSFQYPRLFGTNKAWIGVVDDINYYGNEGIHHVAVRPISWQDYFFMVSVSDKPIADLVKDFISSISWTRDLKQTPIELDGRQGIKVDYKTKTGEIVYSRIFIKNNGNTLILSGGTVENRNSGKIVNPSQETWNNIVSTLKFPS